MDRNRISKKKIKNKNKTGASACGLDAIQDRIFKTPTLLSVFLSMKISAPNRVAKELGDMWQQVAVRRR